MWGQGGCMPGTGHEALSTASGWRSVARPNTNCCSRAVSPVITTEYARDTDLAESTWDSTINKRGTRGVYEPAGPPTPSHLDTLVESLRPATSATMASRSAANSIGDATARRAGVDSFWARTGKSAHLGQRDIVRIGDERGTHAIPGSANCRLVAGKWRCVSWPGPGCEHCHDVGTGT